MSFARDIKNGDSRLFAPLGLLITLAETELCSENKESRDHFFHTFNNLLLGFVILGDLFVDRDHSLPPDRYVVDRTGIARLHPWEALWFLTCLFHDPGYIAERIGLTVEYVLGFPNQLAAEDGPPEQISEQLVNAWDTHHKPAGQDLVSLFQRLKREGDWIPQRFQTVEAEAFNQALRRAYFDGTRVGHSLQSGLYLINRCTADRTPKKKGFDAVAALTACEIAALSMMFHDQHCRDVMRKYNIGPLTFEHLPYAAILMFVDALQDDRRDIHQSEFPKHGVLENVEAYTENNKRIVRARVCLHELPSLEWWPGKIEEYENVTRWINGESKVQFLIDYQSAAWHS